MRRRTRPAPREGNSAEELRAVGATRVARRAYRPPASTNRRHRLRPSPHMLLLLPPPLPNEPPPAHAHARARARARSRAAVMTIYRWRVGSPPGGAGAAAAAATAAHALQGGTAQHSSCQSLARSLALCAWWCAGAWRWRARARARAADAALPSRSKTQHKNYLIMFIRGLLSPCFSVYEGEGSHGRASARSQQPHAAPPRALAARGRARHHPWMKRGKA
eukprot:scaffold488_cov372-Prasinococcus_capsulatus_cf.AAC.8